MTYRELVYLCLDELKGLSDDFDFTEDHIIFLIDKYRAFLLKQRYSDIKKLIPEDNYQTICVELEHYSPGDECLDTKYLRSVSTVPTLMPIGNTRIYNDYYNGEITYISRDRMRYIGYNKFVQNIIYGSIGPDCHLYLKSYNPQFLYLEKVRMTGIFQDSIQAAKLRCKDTQSSFCDVLDSDFPIEAPLVPPLTELLMKELVPSVYRPDDKNNNAKDDLSDIQVNR